MLGAYLHSFILAKLLGLYMIIMAVVYISRAEYYKKIMQNLGNEGVSVMLGASFSLLFGLLILMVHNLWAWEPYLVMTVVGWVILIKSVLWLALPERMAILSSRIFQGKQYYVYAVIMALLGIWILSYATAFIDLIDSPVLN